MKKLFFAIAALILTTSCEKICSGSHDIEPIECPNGQVSSIYGTWSWLETTGGLYGQTPNSTSQDVMIEFGQNETYKRYVNGVLTETSKFKLVEKKSYLTGELETFIEFIPNLTICPSDSIFTINPIQCGITTTWIDSSEVAICSGGIIEPFFCGTPAFSVNSNQPFCGTGILTVATPQISTCFPIGPFSFSKYYKFECNTLILCDDFYDGFTEKFEPGSHVTILY
jgi:hypothetical protein